MEQGKENKNGKIRKIGNEKSKRICEKRRWLLDSRQAGSTPYCTQ